MQQWDAFGNAGCGTDPGNCSVQGRVKDVTKACLGLLHTTEQVVSVPGHPGWSEAAFPQ